MHSLFHSIVLAGSLFALLPFGAVVAATPPDKTSSDIVVYYFHRTARCPTCLTMENWTRQVVAVLTDGECRIPAVMESIDLDEPEHAHFVKDFGLTFSTVVIQNRRTGQWKNLESVWDFAQDEATFKKYLESELTAARSRTDE